VAIGADHFSFVTGRFKHSGGYSPSLLRFCNHSDGQTNAVRFAAAIGRIRTRTLLRLKKADEAAESSSSWLSESWKEGILVAEIQEDLSIRIKSLKKELKAALEEKERAFRYRWEHGKATFEEDVVAEQRKFKRWLPA
jgi:hypothetical protein